MDVFTIIYIIVLVAAIVALIIFYILDNKYKMSSQTKILDSLISELKIAINKYYQEYLKFMKKHQAGIDLNLYKELNIKLKNYNKIENSIDMIEEYLAIDKLLKELTIALEDNNKIKENEVVKIKEQYEKVNQLIQEYNRNVLIMNKYLYMFSSILIAKIYKFKEYPYFRNRE